MDGTGVERIQNYAYEKGVICESIQSGGWLGGPRPDPGLTTWTAKVGRPVRLPSGFSQTEFWETNAGIMIFPDGLVGATGNQTSGDSCWGGVDLLDAVMPPGARLGDLGASSFQIEVGLRELNASDRHIARGHGARDNQYSHHQHVLHRRLQAGNRSL
jgi:hypothetical protein